MLRTYLVVFFLIAFLDPCLAQDGSGATKEDLIELTWPREYKTDGHEVIVFQPQIESWPEHKSMTAQAAIAVTPKGEKEPAYGGIQIETETETSLEDRTVLFKDLKLVKVWFPNADKEKSDSWEKIVRTAIQPQKSMLVSLDRVVSNFERSQQQQRTIEVNLDPPPIFRSEKPAVLVIFLGEPKFEAVEETGLLFATNTNWDLFLEAATNRYYLLNEETWLTTADYRKGPWGATTALPAGFKKLPDNANWDDVRKQIPAKPGKQIPQVFTSTEPAELILTDGAPSMAQIPGTSLLYISNTESDVFLQTGVETPSYYFLTAGRWFRSKNIDGPWSSAMKDLPEDFAKIPEDHPRGRVLTSVPGTPDAATAIIMASIPQKATVNRSDAKVSVTYEGKPQFILIDGTSVYFALNSPYDVFRVGDQYYCCEKGVWFVSKAPLGPWVVCTDVHKTIYSIPSTHPKHNVTYVYVYDSTPSTVVVGYTSGYTGQYVVAGALLFGAGYYIANHNHYHGYYHYHCHASYFSYGCGARYDYYRGGYYRGGYAYGPYGGAGAWSSYNPSTGTYSRGAYRYGPNSSAFARSAYNPHTGNYAARAGGSSPYGSWGRSVVSDGQNWARGGHRSTARGTVAAAEGSQGGKVVAGKRTGGSGGVVAKDRHGDVYVGKDGNVYKRGENGDWQQRGKDSWSSNKTANRATTQSGAASRKGQASSRKPTQSSQPSTGNRKSGASGRSSTSRGGVENGLNKSSRSRQRGNSRAQRSRSSRSSRGGGRGRGR